MELKIWVVLEFGNFWEIGINLRVLIETNWGAFNGKDEDPWKRKWDAKDMIKKTHGTILRWNSGEQFRLIKSQDWRCWG